MIPASKASNLAPPQLSSKKHKMSVRQAIETWASPNAVIVVLHRQYPAHVPGPDVAQLAKLREAINVISTEADPKMSLNTLNRLSMELTTAISDHDISIHPVVRKFAEECKTIIDEMFQTQFNTKSLAGWNQYIETAKLDETRPLQ